MPFYAPENPDYTIFDSMLDSIRFTVDHTLVRGERTIWSKSSFVDPAAEIMHWHDFGDLDGPGWAANAVGGGYEIYRLGRFLAGAQRGTRIEADLCSTALGILDHVLLDGFVDRETGFIIGYRDLARPVPN